MNKQTHVSKLNSFLPPEVDGFDSLAELALDMRWPWSHYAYEVWRQLDPLRWDFIQNPWVILKTVSWEKLKNVIDDPDFRKELNELMQTKSRMAESPAWFQQNHPQAPSHSLSRKSQCGIPGR